MFESESEQQNYKQVIKWCVQMLAEDGENERQNRYQGVVMSGYNFKAQIMQHARVRKESGN